MLEPSFPQLRSWLPESACCTKGPACQHLTHAGSLQRRLHDLLAFLPASLFMLSMHAQLLPAQAKAMGSLTRLQISHLSIRAMLPWMLDE